MRARVGGQGGGHRRLLESDRNWQESDNAFRTPCTPKGGGGFIGLRPTRRPSKRAWGVVYYDARSLWEGRRSLGVGGEFAFFFRFATKFFVKNPPANIDSKFYLFLAKISQERPKSYQNGAKRDQHGPQKGPNGAKRAQH